MSKQGAKFTLVSLSVFAVGVLIFMLYRKKRQMDAKTDARSDENNTNNMNGYYTDKNSLAAINHNPANLTDNESKWVGRVPTPERLIKEGRPTRFVAFDNDFHGLRAAFINLKNGYFAKNYNTIEKIITKWAPPKENNTAGYIDYVSKSMGIDKNETLNPKDKGQMFLLLRAICVKESGFLGDDLITKAINENI